MRFGFFVEMRFFDFLTPPLNEQIGIFCPEYGLTIFSCSSETTIPPEALSPAILQDFIQYLHCNLPNMPSSAGGPRSIINQLAG